MRTLKEVGVLLAFIIMLFISLQVNCSEITDEAYDHIETHAERN